jgi:hypothetical protein
LEIIVIGIDGSPMALRFRRSSREELLRRDLIPSGRLARGRARRPRSESLASGTAGSPPAFAIGLRIPGSPATARGRARSHRQRPATGSARPCASSAPPAAAGGARASRIRGLRPRLPGANPTRGCAAPPAAARPRRRADRRARSPLAVGGGKTRRERAAGQKGARSPRRSL